MAVGKDKVQINIAFITDESREYARLINQNKEFINDLNKAKKNGQDLSETVQKIVDAGKGIEGLDLSKVAPAQLNARARQLKQTLDLIPQSAPQYRALQTELAAINGQLGAINAANRGVANAGQSVWQIMQTGARGFLTAIGPIALALVGLQSLFDGVKKLFNIGVDAEALGTKMSAVFGKSEAVVNQFAESNAKAIGLSRREYKGLATDVGDLLTPMGFTQETAARLSTTLVDQAGILSRWTKGKVDTVAATEILNKSLLGERDALNTLGIDIKDATIQNELKRKGLDKLTGNELKQAEALITLEQITKQSANANADFAKGTEDLQEKKARLRARISEIVDRLGTGMIPMWNKVLGVIIPVVEWVVQFGTRLGEVWQKAETFRAVISSVFGGLYTSIAGVIKGLGSIADGFVELFSGNFSAAAAKFGEGLDNAVNPVRIGINLAEGVKSGWNSVKNPQAQVTPGDPGAATGEGRKLANAFTGGFDAEFARIKSQSKKSAEDVAKERKEQIEAALKFEEAAGLRLEVIAEKNRLDGKTSEIEYGNELIRIKKETLAAQIEVYRKYGQDQTVEALKLQNELAKLQADAARSAVAVPQALTARGISAPQRQSTDDTQTSLDLSKAGTDASLAALRQKFQAALIAEQEYDILRLQYKEQQLNRELEILKASTQPQVEEIRKREEEKNKVSEELSEKRLENQKRVQELEAQVLQAGATQIGDFFSLAAEFLAKDEASKKKHASTIKALQKAQIQLNLVSEISSIFANAQKSPAAQLLGPVAGQLVAFVQAGFATARAALAMRNIEQQKFAAGGYTGAGFGSPDSTGLKPAGIVHGGEYVIPPWMVSNPLYSPTVRALENVRLRRYAQGGLVNTTPSAPIASAPIGGAASDFSGLMAEFAAFRAEISAWQRDLKVIQVYSEFESAKRVITDIQTAAAI